MTNKPMLSVERDLIERAVQAIINTSQMQPALNELRALLDKEVDGDSHRPKQQGGPVAICRLWNEGGSGERTSVEFVGEPCADGALLYAEQPAPVAVVMPKRRAIHTAWDHAYNAALDDVARLNGVKP